MKRNLTETQKRILDYINIYHTTEGYPPSIKEIALHFGYKSNTSVVDHLTALEKKGYINRAGGARTIMAVKKPAIKTDSADFVSVPVVGTVAAGQPVLAVENIENHLVLDRQFAKYNDVFLLKVQGESMIDAHIEDGDLVIVKPQQNADQYDIVVALADGEATVKRLILKKDTIELKPENKNMEPFVFSRDDESVKIIGKVIGVVRGY